MIGCGVGIGICTGLYPGLAVGLSIGASATGSPSCLMRSMAAQPVNNEVSAAVPRSERANLERVVDFNIYALDLLDAVLALRLIGG